MLFLSNVHLMHDESGVVQSPMQLAFLSHEGQNVLWFCLFFEGKEERHLFAVLGLA